MPRILCKKGGQSGSTSTEITSFFIKDRSIYLFNPLGNILPPISVELLIGGSGQ
jgi:hypothetical protein